MITATFQEGSFRDKTVLVSGGTSGIGAAIGNALAELGAIVTVTGATKAEAAEANRGASIGRADALDVRDDTAVAAFFAALPTLDVLINCAGIIRRGAEHDPAVFAEVLDVNLTGTMRLCAAARPLLARTHGCIVNTAIRYLKKGDWQKAHELAQQDESKLGCWAHGIVHLVEGDLGNARYWYRRAGRPFPKDRDVDRELAELTAALKATQ